MTQFDRIKHTASQNGIIVERVGGQYPYEVYRNDDHSSVALCKTLREVEQDIETFKK